MAEWKKVRLGEVLSIKHGYAFPGEGIVSEDNGVVLVTPGNFLIGGGFKESGKKYFKGDYPSEYQFTGGELVVTMTDLSKTSDTLGVSAKIPFSKRCVYLHNQRIGLVTITDKSADEDFVYWFMRTDQYRKVIVAGASGTTVKHTSPSRIRDVELHLPPLPTQRKIAAVLGVLDDKIENNRKICANLEAQAQAIFKSWFVDFEPFGGKMPSGWKMGKLGDMAQYRKERIGSSELTPETFFSTENMIEGKGGCLAATSLPSSGIVPRCEKGDVLVSNIRPYFKKIFRVEKTSGHSPDVLCFAPRHKETQYYLYQLLWDDSFFDYVMSSVKGTKMPRGDKDQILEYQCTIPQDRVIQDFNAIVEPMIKIVALNRGESRALAEMRDALLPKLMSGEIDVEKVKVA